VASLTLTYDDTTARVLLSATSLPATADVALFEVSTDQIHWTQVRGGSAVTISSTAASLIDYEFSPGVVNYYRVSAVDTDLPTFVASSTAVSASGAAVSPTVPVGYAEGDLLVIWASIRNSGTGTVVCPTGWTVMMQTDNIGLFGKRALSSESTPTVSVTGGVTGTSGSDVIAQMACFRNCERTPAATAYQLNPSAQNITYPPMAGVESTWTAVLYLGWKADDWTGVATISGATEIGEPVSTAGLDAGLVWDYQLLTTPAAVSSGVFTVTGGTSVISYGATVALRNADYVTRTSASITPAMSLVWLKFPSAPYLNRSVMLIGWEETERTTRLGFFPIVGKRTAIASTDLHSPRTVTISLFTQDDVEVAAVDLVLSLGIIMLLQTPVNLALKSMYAGVGTYNYVKPAHLSHRNTITVPLTEVSMPDLSIVGATVTWATLITNYTDWSAELVANATWTAVLALQGTPADALVGVS
jgi:hypothetical protein